MTRIPRPVAAVLSDEEDPLLRRTPRQARSQERRDRILDAAAELIAERGIDAATTNAIAERAGTSVGSLYQFFPNGPAIRYALARRYHSAMEDVKDVAFGDEAAALPLDAMMRHIVESLGAFFDAHPAYPRVYTALMDEGGEAPVEAAHESVIARIATMVRARYAWRSVAWCRATAFVQVHAVHAVLVASAPESDPVRRRTREALIELLAGVFREDEARRNS
jgi:AcrR family transcriptional regulator